MKTGIPIKKLDEPILGIKVERMSDGYVEAKGDYVAMAHRNDFCICILPDKGKGNFFVDFKEVNLNPNSVLFLYSGQVSRVLATHNIDGWILYFDNKLIDDYSRSVLEESLYHGPILELSNNQKQWFLQLMELLHSASESRDMSSFHKPVMRSMVMSFIYRLTAIYQASVTQDMKQHSVRSTTIVSTFRKLLRDNYKEIKSPQEYANLMNLSLGYLNDTLKMITGNTVSHSIQEEAIREAQRLLWYSDASIKEISDTVGFEDPKYFSRIFSKVIGTSPAGFRKDSRNEH
jgi:AraC-like DNA-binding protein